MLYYIPLHGGYFITVLIPVCVLFVCVSFQTYLPPFCLFVAMYVFPLVRIVLCVAAPKFWGKSLIGLL